MEYNCQGSLKVYIWSAPNIWSAPTVSVHAVTPQRSVAGSLHSISSPEKYLFVSLRARRSGRSNPCHCEERSDVAIPIPVFIISR